MNHFPTQSVGIERMTYLFVFLLPILPQYVYVVEGVNIVNLLLAVYVVYYLSQRRVRIWAKLKELPLFWLYNLYYVVRVWMDDNVFRGLTNTLLYMLVPLVLIDFTNSEKRFYKVLKCLLAGGLVMAVLGVAEAVMRQNFFQEFSPYSEFFYDIRYGMLRIMVTYGQPIGLGMYFLFIFAFSCYCVKRYPNVKSASVIRVFVFVGLLLTVSRAPIFATLLFSVIFFFTYDFVGLRTTTAKLGFSVLFLFFFYLLVQFVGLDLSFFSDADLMLQDIVEGAPSKSNTGTGTGVGDRLVLQEFVFESLDGHFMWGMGPSAEFSYEVAWWRTKTSIENRYLYELYHTGIVGLVLLLLNYVSVLWYALRSYVNERKQGRHEVSFFFTAFALFLSYYLFSLSVQESDMLRLHLIAVSLLISCQIINKQRIYE